jgi:hypothetical protein
MRLAIHRKSTFTGDNLNYVQSDWSIKFFSAKSATSIPLTNLLHPALHVSLSYSVINLIHPIVFYCNVPALAD